MGEYKPFVNLGPGDTIREELEHYGWDQKDLAEILEMTQKHVCQLVNNKTPVTYDVACLLAKTFKQSPQFWLNLDANYRQRMQESAKVKETEARALIYRYMPVRDLRMLIPLPKITGELIAAVKKFWGRDELDFGFLEKQAANFRKSKAHKQFNPFYALSWLQLARNALGAHRNRFKYDRKGLELLADRIPEFSLRDDGVQTVISELTRCGVTFLQIDHIQKTYTDGATFFDNGRPVIVYTARHDRMDNFWFTLAHEIGHVLFHEDNQGQVFIDSLDNLDLSDQREKDADRFASDKLKHAHILARFRGVQRPSTARVQEVARELSLHPSLVVGCLQHHKKAAWSSFHELKPAIRPLLEASG
jgi:HTH-type transcriptional regulator/antitoxin HigA